MEWLGKAKLAFHHAQSPRVLKEKDGGETDLLKICESSTPPCELNPFLFNGHLQTIWSVTKPSGPEIHYRRKVFEADHPAFHGSFAVDFAVPPFEDHDPTLLERTAYFTDDQFASLPSDDKKPMLVVLHGLSGGSHEVYLRETIAPLIKDGWQVCVVNSRGCAKSKITTGVLYNARATWDIRQVVNWLRKTFPNRPLFGIGFSLGANMLTNYCGEEGSNCQLKAAIVCSNPFNLDVASKFMRSYLFGREVYLRAMGGAMKALVAEHKENLTKFTNLDMEGIDKVTYLYEFDRMIQCPTWGYPTEHAYYRDASSIDAVLAIRIPFLAIQALDDPIAVKEGLPFEEIEQNPNTVMLTSSLGGHLCWFESGGGRWHPRPVRNFFNYFANKIDLDDLEPSPEPESSGMHARASTYVPMRRKLGMF